MEKLIIFLDKLFNLYLYYIIGACILSWVPNINPDFPLFHFIFVSAGFYIIPPFMGISFSPAFVMMICALIIMGLRKIYEKFYAKDRKEIIIITKEDLDKIKQQKDKEKDNNNDI